MKKPQPTKFQAWHENPIGHQITYDKRGNQIIRPLKVRWIKRPKAIPNQ